MTTIRVTQEHIDSGDKGRATSCPIANALRCEGYVYPSVCAQFVRVGARMYNLPDSVTNFIQNFDKGVEVEPFEFELVLINIGKECGNG